MHVSTVTVERVDSAPTVRSVPMSLNYLRTDGDRQRRPSEYPDIESDQGLGSDGQTF
jgi:hypothetical protein